MNVIPSDCENQPDLDGFWPRTQDQYLQFWDYACKMYHDAFTGADVKIVGPSTSSQASLTNTWWSKWADHVKTSGNVSIPIPSQKFCFADFFSKIPDWWSCHQLNGRGSANCGNDPVVTSTQLSQVCRSTVCHLDLSRSTSTRHQTSRLLHTQLGSSKDWNVRVSSE